MSDATPLGRADLSHRRPWKLDRFHFGTCYYPEHWDAATRAGDPARMAAAGFNIVRMGDFAWEPLEPAEGRYDFALYDDAIARFAAHGIATLLCTPTAGPPCWLTEKHPEILRENEAGQRMQHGSRQHACYGNPTFRAFACRIARAFSAHYRENSHVVGWQIDNEFHCAFSECHCPACQDGFRAFLRRRYHDDIQALNAAWGTVFWSQRYSDFAQIRTPRPNRPQSINPAQKLDYYRYLSDAVTQFQHEQVAIVRETNPRWFVLHNGGFPHIDYRGPLLRDLDVMGFDTYPMFESDPDRRPATQQGLLTDLIRSMSGNFLVAEHQSGPGGAGDWMTESPEPGEVRAMSYRSIARGADSLIYFRWRTCRFGAEKYWCGILDHDDVPRHRYAEIARLGRELQTVGPALLGTHVVVEAAIAGNDSMVDDAHGVATLGLPHLVPTAQAIYRPLFDGGYAVGFIHPEDDLSGVRLYIIPHWTAFNPAWVAPLTRFVEAGGTLVIGARTATSDTDGNVVSETFPGVLRPLAGITVEAYGKLSAGGKRKPTMRFADGVTLAAEHWYEHLRLESATPLATWCERHLAGEPAVTVNRVGAGRVVYVGTWFAEKTAEVLIPRLVALAGLRPQWPELPPGVDVTQRTDGRRTLWFFINHADQPRTLRTTPPGANLLGGVAGGGELRLGVHDVAVFEAETP